MKPKPCVRCSSGTSVARVLMLILVVGLTAQLGSAHLNAA
jgi:hypothetical protein